METVSPHVRTIPVRCAPSKAPCPTCGKLGQRKATHNRLVRTIAYKRVVYLDVTYGEYRARCRCRKTFRTTPPGVEPRASYDNSVRQAVLDRILDDGMSVERVIASMRRDFLLDLSDGFVYDCLDWEAGDSTWPAIAAGSCSTSAAPCASTNCTWAEHLAAGHRPARRSARGLRPGRRPTTPATCDAS